MNYHSHKLLKFIAITGLVSFYSLPAYTQEPGAGERLNFEERRAQREQRREEFLADNPDVAERLEELRQEREARREEFLANNPDPESRREAIRVEREARRLDRETRREEFLANNPDVAARLEQRRVYRHIDNRDFNRDRRLSRGGRGSR